MNSDRDQATPAMQLAFPLPYPKDRPEALRRTAGTRPTRGKTRAARPNPHQTAARTPIRGGDPAPPGSRADWPRPPARAGARPWRLDERTCEIGRRGVEAARALLGDPGAGENRRAGRPGGSAAERQQTGGPCRLRAGGTTVKSMPSVADRLDYPPEAKLLILNCADLGLCHAATVGVYEALREGIGTSASLIVPAPWARESASRFRGDDVGVQLTLNAELDLYRWGPITQAPSLLDGDGGFPRTVTDLWDHADIDEVRRECRAQIERAVLWGFDISYLHSHLDALVMRPEFFDVYLELAVDFGLPLRLLGAEAEPNVGFPVRQLASDEGVLYRRSICHIAGPARHGKPSSTFLPVSSRGLPN